MIFMDINPVDDLKKMDQYVERCAETAKSKKVTTEVIENLSKLWLDLEESYKVGRIENPDRCLEAVLICTAQLIFNVQYHKEVSESSKNKLKSLIDSCAETMNDVAHRRNICKGITTVVNDPWKSKAFKELTRSSKLTSGLYISAQVSDAIWETEGWVMLETRLDYLTRFGTNVEVINKVCSLIHVLVNRGHEFFQNNGYDPTITPEEQETFNPFKFSWSKYLKYLQVYAILVYKEKINEKGLSSWNPVTILKVIEELEKIKDCTDRNLFPGFKGWNESAAVAKFLAKKGTLQCVQSEGGDAATLEILFSKWILLSGIDSDEIKSASESPFTPLLDSIINLSASTENLYKLAPRTLELKFTKKPDLTREMCLTIYVRAMNKDINSIESIKTSHPEEIEKIEKMQKRLSVRYMELAIFFKEFLATAMNCLLTAFSLNPCDQLFECLFPGKLSGSENVPVPCFAELEKFRCSLDELKKIPVSDADPKVVDKLPYPDELLEALDIVITNPRYKGLSRWVSKSESEQLCRKLLESKSVGALENRSLEFVNIDYEKFQDFKPQYDPDDDGIERGFRWGIRKINTTKSRAKNVLNRARMTFKSVTSSDTAGEVKRKRRIADLSKGRPKILPSPNGVIRKGRPPKLKSEHDSNSVVNNGAKKDIVDTRGIPNICLSQNPWWSGDDDKSSVDIAKFGYGEMYMTFIRPYDNLMREKTGTGKNSEDDSKILSRVKRTLLPDFTAEDTSTGIEVGSSQPPNHEGPESTGECPAKIEETPTFKQEPMDGFCLPKTEKSQTTLASANPPVTNSNDSTAPSSASSYTPWNRLEEGDGFPHDPYNEQIFRDIVFRLFIETNIYGAKQVTKDNVETTKPIPQVKEKKEKVRKRKEPSTTETKTEKPKPEKKIRTSNTNSAKRKRSTGAIDTSAKLSEESSVHNSEIEITSKVIKTEEAEECVSQPENAAQEILPIQLEPCGAFMIMSIKKDEGPAFTPNASGVGNFQNPMPLRTIKSDPVPPPISNSSFQLQSSMQQASVTAFSYQRSSLAGSRKSRKSSATEEQMQKWNDTITSVSTGPFTLPPTLANANTSNDIFVTNISNKPEHKNPSATGPPKIDLIPRPTITKTYPAKKKRLVVIPSRMYEEFNCSTPSMASPESVIPEASRLSMESNANQLNAAGTNIVETQTGDGLNSFSCAPSQSGTNSALPTSPSISCSSDDPTITNLAGIQTQSSSFDQSVPSVTNLVGSTLPNFPRCNDVVSPYTLASTPVNSSVFNQSTAKPRLKSRKIKIAGFPSFYDQSCSSETVPIPASTDSSNSSLQSVSGLAVSDHALAHTNTYNESEKILDKAHEIVENIKVTEVDNSLKTNVTSSHSEMTSGQETKNGIICAPSSELLLNAQTVNEKPLADSSKNRDREVVVSNVCASKDTEKQNDKSKILVSDSSSDLAQKVQNGPIITEIEQTEKRRSKDVDNKISDLVNHVSCNKMDCPDGENKHAEAKPIIKLSESTRSTSLIAKNGEQQKVDVDVQVQNDKQVSGTNLLPSHDEPVKSSRSGSSVKAAAPFLVQLGYNMQLLNLMKKDVKNGSQSKETEVFSVFEMSGSANLSLNEGGIVKANLLTKSKEAAKPVIDKSSKESVSGGEKKVEPPTSVADTVGQSNLNECSSDLSILPTSTNQDKIPSSTFLDAVSSSKQEKVDSNLDKTLSNKPVVEETLSPTLLEKGISPADSGKVPFIEGNVPLSSDHEKAPSINELEKGCSSTDPKTVTPLSELAKVSINPVKVPLSSKVSEVEPEQPPNQVIEKDNEVSDLAKSVTPPTGNFEHHQDSISLPVCFSNSIESNSEKNSKHVNVSPNKICVSPQRGTEDLSCNSITNQNVDLNLNISEEKRPTSFNNHAETRSNDPISPDELVIKCASSGKNIITAAVEKNEIIVNSFSGFISTSTEIAGTTSNISSKEEEKTENSDKMLTPDIANSKQEILLINHDEAENTVEENLEHPVSLSPTSALQRDVNDASKEGIIIIGDTNCDNAGRESHNHIDLNDSSCYSPKEKLRDTHCEISSEGTSLDTLCENVTCAIPENAKNILPNDDIVFCDDKIPEEIISEDKMAEEVLDVTQALPETLCKESDMNTLMESAKPSTKAVNKVHVLNDESNDSIKSLAPNDIDPFIDDLINGYDYPVKGIRENVDDSVNLNVGDDADPLQTNDNNSSHSRPGSSASVDTIKVPRPVTPVHVVEDIINRQLKKQPKRPYDEVETIKISPSALETIRKDGRLTRLLLCSVKLTELSSEEISPKIRNQLKELGSVKRSSRLKKKKRRAVEVIRNVLQSANKNENESSSEEEEEEEKNDRSSLSNERVVEIKYQRPGPKSKKKEELAKKDVDSYLRKVELYKSKREEEAAKIKLPVGQQLTARKRGTGSPQKVKQTSPSNSIDSKTLLVSAMKEARSSSDPKNQIKKVVKQQKRSDESKVLPSSKKLKTKSSRLKDYSDSSSDSDDTDDDPDFVPFEDEEEDSVKTATTSADLPLYHCFDFHPPSEEVDLAANDPLAMQGSQPEEHEEIFISSGSEDNEEDLDPITSGEIEARAPYVEEPVKVIDAPSSIDDMHITPDVITGDIDSGQILGSQTNEDDSDSEIEFLLEKPSPRRNRAGRLMGRKSVLSSAKRTSSTSAISPKRPRTSSHSHEVTQVETYSTTPEFPTAYVKASPHKPSSFSPVGQTCQRNSLNSAKEQETSVANYYVDVIPETLMASSDLSIETMIVPESILPDDLECTDNDDLAMLPDNSLEPDNVVDEAILPDDVYEDLDTEVGAVRTDEEMNSFIIPELTSDNINIGEEQFEYCNVLSNAKSHVVDSCVQDRTEEIEASCEGTDANSSIVVEAIVEDVAEPEDTMSRKEEIRGRSVQERAKELETSSEDTDVNSSLLPEVIVEDVAELDGTLSRREEIRGHVVQERPKEIESARDDADANSSLSPEAIAEDVAEPEGNMSRTEEIGDNEVQEIPEEIESARDDTDANSSLSPAAIVEDVAEPESTLSSTEEIRYYGGQERPEEMESVSEDTDARSSLLPEEIVEDVAERESIMSSTEEIGDYDVQERHEEMEASSEDTDANSCLLAEAIAENVAELENSMSSLEEIEGYNVQDLVTDKNNEQESLESSVLLDNDSQTSEHSCSPGLPELSPVHSAFERMDYSEDDSPPSLSAVV